MKLVIFGSRNAYPTDKQIEDAIDSAAGMMVDSGWMGSTEVTELVCGMARGADESGYQWAKANNIPIKEFPADWERYGKRAGFIRNKAMAEYADVGIGFWKDESPGTANMVAQLVRARTPVLVV